MKNRDRVSAKFQAALVNRLKTKFGKVVSAQRFSDMYNLNAHDSTTICRETARLWIRGNAMPDYGHLAVLVRWLGLNPDEFLGSETPSPVAIMDEKPGLPTGGRGHADNDLLALWDELDPESRETLLALAKALLGRRAANRPSDVETAGRPAIAGGKAQLPTDDCHI